jgi:hypothetical protein
MRLYLCDCALERARVALARIEASTPLTARGANSPKRLLEPSPTPPAGAQKFHDEAQPTNFAHGWLSGGSGSSLCA